MAWASLSWRHFYGRCVAACALELAAGAEAHFLRQADADLAQIFAVAVDADAVGRHARIRRDKGRLHVGRLHAAFLPWEAGRYRHALMGFAQPCEIVFLRQARAYAVGAPFVDDETVARHQVRK